MALTKAEEKRVREAYESGYAAGWTAAIEQVERQSAHRGFRRPEFRSSAMPTASSEPGDFMTPFLLGTALGSSTHANAEPGPSYEPRGGEFGGAGASGGWDSGSSDAGSCSDSGGSSGSE